MQDFNLKKSNNTKQISAAGPETHSLPFVETAMVAHMIYLVKEYELLQKCFAFTHKIS